MNYGGYECKSDYDSSEIVVLPVPFDHTSSWIKGSDKGPAAIIEASPNLEFYDIETASDIRHRGIFTLPEIVVSTPEDLLDKVSEATDKIYQDKKFPVVIGGNHTVSIGAVAATTKRFENVTILQLDAHSDFRQSYEGSELNHACAMARISEMADVVQVGIRSMAEEELEFIDPSKIFYAQQLYFNKELFNKALEQLSENVYITIDLDVLDSGIMPSTGTPEPGGLNYWDLLHFLRKVIEKRRVVGFDVVELCPIQGNRAPDFLAAKLIYQVLSYQFSR